MAKPEFKDDPLYTLLRRDEAAAFNAERALGRACDLRGADLRGVDLRKADLRGLDLSDAYLRQADLRGVDLRETRLEGASLFEARISGAFFPPELRAEEITLSLLHGTRLRYG
ncbi:MAG: pentapeptide repeat-containing protein [Gammaproteobacteria bacterium]|jgi:uncharacterized protein YjbI with pentapeptide repeats|nr:pentapeptide repeat-containing protein [Gammaproteobacteria bacterium]